MKEYELLKIKDITYTNRGIIYNKNFKQINIPYNDISSFYICIKPCLIYLRNFSFAKYICICMSDGKKHYIQIGVSAIFSFYGSFEQQHISFIKKMAPHAKFIKKERIIDKIKRIITFK